ncbi:phage tail tape measure protein [Paracoccus pantotrophus]|uniref:phage tail tape measure protein n=1 Tax=Paracoccus pantotrophus TaxID=82367 RepID=UPI000F427205|nr:phage tail tape measure protein [Paracoccus pantotrophus]RNI21003.1 hypothetical protein EB844_00135 [Paracoccus pantotrophus]
MNATAGIDEKLVVALEARVSEFDKRLRQAEQRGTRTYQNLQRGSRSATRQMEQDMARSAASIRQSVASVTGSVGSLGKALAGGFLGGMAVGGIAELVGSSRQIVRSMAEIGNEAKRAGLSAQAFQEWKYVAEANRISVDALVDGFKELSLRADEFITTGVGPAAEAFGRLGFRAEDLKRKLKDPSALMLEIMQRLEGMDKAAQIRIADEIFGGTGGERFVEMLGQGDAALRDTIARAHETGAVFDDELIGKAEDLDRRFRELQTTAGNFFKRMVVGAAEAAAEMTDLRARLDEIFGSEAQARAAMGDSVYDAYADNRDLVDENAEALGRLEGQYQLLSEEATKAGMAMRDAIGKLDAWGYGEVADDLRRLVAEQDDLVRAWREGEVSGEDFAVKLDDIQTRARDAFDELEAGDRVQFNGVISQLQRLGGVISGVITLAGSLKNALASAAGVSGDQLAMKALRDRHAAEKASLDSANAMREANDKFTASEQARNAATREQLALEREVANVRKRAKDMGATLTEAQIQSFAQEALAGEAARSAAGKGGRSSKGKAGGKEKQDEFAREVESIRERTEALQIEAQVLAEVAASSAEYGDAMEFARKKAELLHAAQQAGKQITPELGAEVDRLAQEYVTAGLNAEQAAEKLDQIKGATERGKNALEDMFGSIIDGSASAKDAVASLLAEIAKAQVIKGIMGLPGMGSLSSVIGGALSFDGGGYTGNASRSGGIDGKGGFLAIMHPRETVVDHTKSTRPAGPDQSGGSVDVRVAVDQNGNLQAFVEKVSGKVTAQVVATNARRQSDQKYLRGGR